MKTPPKQSFNKSFITELTSKYGLFAHLDSTAFYNKQRHSFLVSKLKEEFKRSKELFSKHFKTKYEEEELPPLWISAELMTMGQISNWLNNIQARQDKQNIYNTIIMCEYLMDTIDKDNIWRDRLESLLTEYKIDKTMMGYK